MKKTLISAFAMFFIGGLLLPVQAQTLFPENIQEIFDLLGPQGSGVVPFIVSRVQLALFIAIGLLVLVAVFYALLSAFKYIRSQGDPGEIEEAQKAIKAIFFGLAAMLIAIIGIVLVFVFFGLGTPEPELFQTCLSAPNSIACQRCQQDGQSNTCQFCEAAYEALSTRRIPDTNGDGQLSEQDLLTLTEIDGRIGNGRNCVEPLQGGNTIE